MNDVVPVGAVVDAHRDRQHRQPEHRPQRLLVRNRYGCSKRSERHHGRRAVDHDDAGADQQQRGDEQHLVRLELSRHGPYPVKSILSTTPQRPTATAGAPRPSAKIPTLTAASDPRRTVSGQQSSAGPWNGTPTSQTGVVCVPSGRLPPAPSRLTTAHCSRLLTAPGRPPAPAPSAPRYRRFNFAPPP